MFIFSVLKLIISRLKLNCVAWVQFSSSIF